MCGDDTFAKHRAQSQPRGCTANPTPKVAWPRPTIPTLQQIQCDPAQPPDCDISFGFALLCADGGLGTLAPSSPQCKSKNAFLKQSALLSDSVVADPGQECCTAWLECEKSAPRLDIEDMCPCELEYSECPPSHTHTHLGLAPPLHVWVTLCGLKRIRPVR